MNCTHKFPVLSGTQGLQVCSARLFLGVREARADFCRRPKRLLNLHVLYPLKSTESWLGSISRHVYVGLFLWLLAKGLKVSPPTPGLGTKTEIMGREKRSGEGMFWSRPGRTETGWLSRIQDLELHEAFQRLYLFPCAVQTLNRDSRDLSRRQGKPWALYSVASSSVPGTLPTCIDCMTLRPVLLECLGITPLLRVFFLTVLSG